MHKALFLFTVVVVLLTACSAQEGAKRRPGKLTVVEYDRLLKINHVQLDVIEAKNLAYAFMTPLAASDKVQKLASKMGATKCQERGEIPDEWMYGARREQEIMGNACPIYWSLVRQRTETALIFVDNLDVKDKDFGNEAELMGRRIAGTLERRTSGGGYEVAGTLDIGPFEVAGYGVVQGAMTIYQKYVGGSGSGSLKLELNGKNWGHTGSVNWNFRAGENTAPLYKIDNAKVNDKDFDNMFSAFEVTKIVANVMNMK